MYVLVLFALVGIGLAIAVRGVQRRRTRATVLGIGLVVATAAFFGLMSLWAEFLWYEELGFTRRFWTEVLARLGVAVAGSLVALALTWTLTLPVRRETGPARGTRWVAILISALVGAAWGAASFGLALRWAMSAETSVQDPVLGMNTSFYLFSLPFYDAVFWLLFLVTVIAALVPLVVGIVRTRVRIAMASADELDEEHPRPVSPRALFVSIGAIALTLALGRVLATYHLMYSRFGAGYGAGWTDVHVRLPANYATAALLAVAGVLLLLPRSSAALERLASKRVGSSESSTLVAAGAPLGVAALVALVGLGALPPLFQWLVVQPNELALEQRYIAHSIEFTRRGFALDDLRVEACSSTASTSRTSISSVARSCRA